MPYCRRVFMLEKVEEVVVREEVVRDLYMG
jgi:hypothetical protein